MNNLKCPNCGLANFGDASNCKKCNTPFQESHSSYQSNGAFQHQQSAVPVAPPAQVSSSCAHCGGRIIQQTAFCPDCGTPRQQAQPNMFSNPTMPAKSEIRIIKLNCVSCGSGLNFSDQLERLACGHCGTHQIVERSGGAVHLRGVTEAIAKVQTGTDKTAAELALNRLSKELEAVTQQRAQKVYYWQAALTNCRSKLNNTTVIILALGVIPAFIVSGVFNAIAGGIMGQQAGTNAGIIGFLAAFGGIAFLARTQLIQFESLNPNKVVQSCNYDLEQVDKHIANIQMRMQQNYKIANA